ncbi:hypothetical protein PLEOSDRAFT_1085332 [Pleurotus ostreatus PC15]|uniref:PH domain-containing protein n=1 Tax=Pleurotus ostreatus (strain PC15) TaxID=1137138 RepID=A0A067NGD8_PLEO1|nr:hypothetical protein PLEOSDRAFT_1085332 [Pleurotus ostreatus PC15]
MVPGPPSSMLSSRGQDFTSDLDTDFLDFTDDNDGDDDDFDDFDDPTVEPHFSASFDVNNEHSFQMQPLSQEHLDVSPESLSGADSSSSLSRSSSSSRSLSSSSSLSDSEDRICRDSQSRHSTSRRSDDFKHSTSGQPHSSSAESDSDIPNSPPDESYFIFPRSLSPDCLLVDEGHEELDGVGYEIGSGVDVPYHGLDRTPHHSIYFHHSNSLSMGSTDAAAFEPGSSEGTIRGSSFHAWALSRGRRHSNKWMTGDDDGEMVEGSEWQGGQNGHYSSNGSTGYYGGNSGYGRASGRSNGGFGGGSNWGNGGDDGDDRRGRRGREGHGHHTDPISGSEEEQSESEDDYGVPSASQSKKTVPNDYSASDDDVPLAQRIPTALRAQKTIRRKQRKLRISTSSREDVDKMKDNRRRSISVHDNDRKSLQRQTPSPIPPLPLADIKTTVITQQRVFIGDMQSFNTVEISSNTTAQDVLDMVKAQGSLKQFVGSGGWMLFEVAQDFGMERPIRSFELLADVQASWNKDKMVNMFVIKMTSLTGILSRSNIPSSSPMHSGWVEWEAKRGKWTKRWMQLREHSLWLSKRDSGKDETFLCSLSNFDAYAVTRVHKAPKPYVFATKSTDNLSFFENTADYLHVFSCSQKDGEKWMEVILLARSYVLYQEKNVLFNPKAGSSTSGTGLSRSGTRKTPSGRTGSLLHRKS